MVRWYNLSSSHRGLHDSRRPNQPVHSSIADEIGSDNHNTAYTITMAKTSQPNSATSEFFINAVDNSKITYQDGSTFDGTYSVFGRVVAGQNVVDAIANAQVTTNAIWRKQLASAPSQHHKSHNNILNSLLKINFLFFSLKNVKSPYQQEFLQ